MWRWRQVDFVGWKTDAWSATEKGWPRASPTFFRERFLHSAPWYSSVSTCTLNPMTDLFDVLADETRRAIVGRLKQPSPHARGGEAELSVSELVEAVGVTQPTVSKHLKVLREADIVRVREDGQHRYYRLNPDGVSPVASWLADVVGVQSNAKPPMELQQPYVDLWSVGFRVGSLVADARDAVVGLIGRRF